ncbi:hypothetical protein GCM10027159_01340 [Lysobacter terrae]
MKSPGGKVLLLGALGLLLQQVPVFYTATLFGNVEPGVSLVQLHVGLLLAIALLERDRRVLAGVVVILFFGWLVRGYWQAYHMAIAVPTGMVAHALSWAGCCYAPNGWVGPSFRVQCESTRGIWPGSRA